MAHFGDKALVVFMYVFEKESTLVLSLLEFYYRALLSYHIQFSVKVVFKTAFSQLLSTDKLSSVRSTITL
jgi:hypothetical protein